ncbi:MAG: hypothetical protein JWM59_2213 [Verrucomicrobiales bacterium]|nr:hypothetical protein [Verrucomicrobiales bacterium]
MKIPVILLTLTAVWTLRAVALDAARQASTVVLDETGVKNLRIETIEAEETTFEETAFALGRIEVLPGRRAVVSSRIPGRALSVQALPDTLCQAGDELLWVESRQPGDPPPTVRIEAPISGFIAEVKIAPGQPVSPEDSLMEIYDLSVVEASAAVPEHLAGRLKPGQKAHIRATGHPDKVFEATLAHLGVRADADNGTIEAAFHVGNPDHILRPGMRAEFSLVLSEREGVVSVPRSALQGDAAQRFMYVEDFGLKNAFVKTPVEVGEINDRFVEITGGLLPGDKVVTKGAYSLAFAGGGTVSLKAALDAAHGHEHAEDGSELTPAKLAEQAAKKRAEAGLPPETGGGGGVSPLWRHASAVLFVLLLISLIVKRGKGPVEEEPHKALAGKEGAE